MELPIDFPKGKSIGKPRKSHVYGQFCGQNLCCFVGIFCGQNLCCFAGIFCGQNLCCFLRGILWSKSLLFLAGYFVVKNPCLLCRKFYGKESALFLQGSLSQLGIAKRKEKQWEGTEKISGKEKMGDGKGATKFITERRAKCYIARYMAVLTAK